MKNKKYFFYILIIIIFIIFFLLSTIKTIEKYQNYGTTVIALCANMQYFEKALKTIEEIRSIGKYNGDIVFFYNEEFINKDKLNLLKQKYNVILQEFPLIDSINIIEFLNLNPNSRFEKLRNKMIQYHKFYIFDTYFKNWDTVLYVDSGIKIFNSIDRILKIETDDYLLAHSDSFPEYVNKLDSQFDLNNNYFNDLKNNYNLYDDYFQSTILLFKTGIIKNDTVLRLIELMNTYPIGDGDQAYMNLYFINNWKPIPIKDEVGFLYDWWKRDNNKETDYVMLKY